MGIDLGLKAGAFFKPTRRVARTDGPPRGGFQEDGLRTLRRDVRPIPRSGTGKGPLSCSALEFVSRVDSGQGNPLP